MSFHVGQKVEVIHSKDAIGKAVEGARVHLGQILTVRDVDTRAILFGVIGLRFEEIHNPIVKPDRWLGIGDSWEIAYDARSFRPLIERKTDISALTALLNPKRPQSAGGRMNLLLAFAIFVALCLVGTAGFILSRTRKLSSADLETLKAEIARRERLHLPRAELRHKLVMGMAEKLNVEMK